MTTTVRLPGIPAIGDGSEADLALMRDVWAPFPDVTAAVAASSQVATAANPLMEEGSREEASSTGVSPRGRVEAGR